MKGESYLGSLQHVRVFLQRVGQSFLCCESNPAEASVEARLSILVQQSSYNIILLL